MASETLTHTLLRLASKVRGLAHGKHWYHTGGFLLVLHWRDFAIGPMLAYQNKQISILREATLLNMMSSFIKPNGNFDKPKDLKGTIRKILKPVAILSWSLD
jgi:hypothetical protein